MWKKGSYDVSNRQHDNNQLSVVVFDDQHRQTIISFEKTEPASNRLKWISLMQAKLMILLFGALFLIIFVLIGVIVWLSVSIHLNNRDNIRTISTTMDLLVNHKFNQHTNSEPYSADGIGRDIDQSCGISCAEILRAMFHLTEHGTTMKETDFAKSSLPNRPNGTTTIGYTSNERFLLLETNHRTKNSNSNDGKVILQKPTINETDENETSENDSDSAEDSSDEVDKEIMGKKKEYNLSEIDTEQTKDYGTDKKESFTVQEYDAIANEGVTDHPCKQSEDDDQEEIDNDRSSGENRTDGEEENQPIQKQADCEGEENVNHQPINGSLDNQMDNADNSGTSKKQIPTSKAEEKYTTVDLEETKHAPDPSKRKPIMFWLRKNLFLVIGISFVIALIAVISIVATPRRKPSVDGDEFMARKANTAGFEPAKDENPNDFDYNSEVSGTTPAFPSTESDIGNTPWATVNHSEISPHVSTTERVANITEGVTEHDDYDYDYSGNVKNLTKSGSGSVI